MPVELWFPVPVFHQDVDPHVRDVTHAKVKTYLETEGAKRDVSPVPFESLETSYFAAKTSVLEDAKLAELKETVLRAGDAFVKGLAARRFLSRSSARGSTFSGLEHKRRSIHTTAAFYPLPTTSKRLRSAGTWCFRTR